MRRSLDIVGQDSSSAPTEPEVLRVGESTVVIQTSGPGPVARGFAEAMIEAGAVRAAVSGDVGDVARGRDSIRIVIRNPRSTNVGAEEAMEADADFVLATARPAFARHLVDALQGAAQS